MADRFETARAQIYAAHEQDPTRTAGGANGEQAEAYEVHYARKMEAFLAQRAPHASDLLRLAICGQHFRRWEVPRTAYPMTRPGYHTWRTHLKKRQAQQVGAVLAASGYEPADVQRCAALIAKEGLRKGESKDGEGEDEEVQILEDVACLVFLDDQFNEFREKHDEAKIVAILRKTWGKMSPRGHEMALALPMTDECKALVTKALDA